MASRAPLPPLTHFLAFFALFLLGGVPSVPASEPSEPRPARTPFDRRLFDDWLYQEAGLNAEGIFDGENNDKIKRVVEEILASIREEEIARNGEVAAETEGKITFFSERLANLAAEKAVGADPRWADLFEETARLRRTLRLSELADDTPTWIFAKHYVLGGSHYAYTEDVTDAQTVEQLDRRPGGALCRLTIHADGTTSSETLLETATGTIRDPEVSYDGKKIVFSKRDNFDTDDFHLFDYDVKTGAVRQLTHGLGYADVEPVYLPDGSLLFGSTRCVQITDCWWTDVANLYACDADGRYLRRVTFDQVTDNGPKVTEDGRVLYTRWDYNDRGQIYPQGLFVMNPDGTGQTAFYGNNSWFPTTILHARGIPDSGGKVVAIASGHHTRQRGKLLMIDRDKGTEEDEGCHLLAPIRPSDAPHIDTYGQDGEQFQYPYPLDERNFVVAYRPEPVTRLNGRENYDPPFGIYWIDADGNRELLAWDPAISSGQPIPLKGRPTPILRPSAVDYAKTTGEYYVQDVYAGPGLAGIERGTIKSLRVVALEFRAAGIFSNGNHGPAGGAMVATPVGVSGASWDVKRVLGEVPVEEDGSARFVVPARTPVYFQLLDANGDAVQTMRSWSTLQPNEVFGCIGCHEPKGTTVDNIGGVGESKDTRNQTLALRQPAAIPTPITPNLPGRAEKWGFSFLRDLQPILDRHCVVCHDGGLRPAVAESKEVKAGVETATDSFEASHPFSLTADDAIPVIPYPKEAFSGRAFSRAYLNLTDAGNLGKIVTPINIQESPAMLPPYHAGAAKSPLMKLLRDPDDIHRDVKLSDAEIRTIALWIDLLVPYCGDYAEAADWPRDQEARYAYNLLKQGVMAERETRNIARKQAVSEGKETAPAFESIERVEDFGRARREAFFDSFVEAFAFPPPTFDAQNVEPNLVRRRSANESARSNSDREKIRGIVPFGLALLPLDETFPMIRTNSVFGYRADSEAANVADGRHHDTPNSSSEEKDKEKKEKEKNASASEKIGEKTTSLPNETMGCWSPNNRRDAWLEIDFGREVEIGRLVLYHAVGEEFDDFWKTGRLEFSDGSAEEIRFADDSPRDDFSFPPRRVRRVRLTNLRGVSPGKRAGIEEVEIFGPTEKR